MAPIRKKKIVRLCVPAALLLLGAVYLLFDPSGSALFPKCPFLMLTGLECPGCGSQRALHYLLNGEIASAWRMNPLLLIAMPYAAVGIMAELTANRYAWAATLRSRLYGATAAWITLAAIAAYTVLRNIF